MSRRSLLGLASGLTVALTGCSAGGRPGASADPTPPVYRYGDHPSQFAELTLPAAGGPVPVVVIVHGGFWRTGYGAELGRPLAIDLVARGWAALNVEYRRVGQSPHDGGGGWPQTGADVAAAVDALPIQGQQLAGGRLDLTRVIGLGHSAGGHLVGWLAGRAPGPTSAPGANPVVRLSGFVAQAGVLDLVAAAAAGLGGRAVSDLMGGGPAARAEAYKSASPIARLPFGVPSVCVHGGRDAIVPIDQSARFVAAATKAGDTSELRSFDGDHFDPIMVGSPAWTLCIEALDRLVRR